MRASILALAAIAALVSLPASADHHHHGGYYPRSYVSFGYGYPFNPGFGYGFGYGYGPYSPWYGYGPSFGVGVRVSPRPAAPAQSSSGEQRALKMYVYPAAGQSQAQTAEDRYQCHVWAADQSGYDPTLGAGNRDDAEGYTRAFTACMQGRNYVVK